MNKELLKRHEFLCSLVDEVNSLKECNNDITNEFVFMFTNKNDSSLFEEQNDRVFNINLYILRRLFNKEIKDIEKETGKFGLDEYYTLIESLELPETIYRLYMEMPIRHQENKILSYATDIPSFMGIKKTN